jgi:phosphoribosylanthranilate isomerase
MIKVKICGITSLEDALTAIEAGADSLGFVFYSASPRNVSPEQADEIIRRLPPFVQTVGLFVDEKLTTVNDFTDRCGLDLVQLHGDEAPDYCRSVRRRVIKAFRIKDISTLDLLPQYQVAGYLLDAWAATAHGGTGKTFNWEIAAEAVRKGRNIVLAGGLTPENVAAAVKTVRPYAVDVSSGVESAPGRKDTHKLIEFIYNAKH